MSIIDDLRNRFASMQVYRVFPDYCSSGIWLPKAVGARGSGPNLIIDDFDISDALKSRFRVWQSIFDEQIPPQKMMTADETPYFSAEEFNLALLLSQELGSRGVVEWEMGGFYLLLEAGVAVALYERLPPPSTEEIFGGKFDGI